MALLTLLLFLLPFHLLPPGAKSDPRTSCPKTILCTDFTLEFPFTDASNPSCGLILVADCNASTKRPKIILPGFAEHCHPILEKMSGNNFSVVFSPGIGGCVSFRDLFSLPKPLLFTFSPNITLIRCVNETTDNVIDDFFKYYSRLNWSTSQSKSDSKPVCYVHPTDGLHDLNETRIPKKCSKIQLPMNEKPSGDPANLYSWLTPNFTVEWSISPGCHRIDNTNKFDCNEGSNRTTVIVLAICIPGGVILLFLAGYIIWQRKKKFGGVYLLPRNISSDPSSRSFVEDGSFNFGIPIFSYTELEGATSNFDSSQELGDGGFGTVYYGKLQDGREVAIKRLYEHNYRRVEQFLNEIKILTSLRHPNLVSLYGCTSRRSRELLLVYEYISNGTVADHLHGERAKEALLTWPIRMSIARETAIALAYLHKSDIIHRDVKTTNILLDNNFSVKVADFGLSRLFPVDVTHISTAPQGTPGYVDPEYHQCYQLTDKSDVYSFGVVLIELISSMPAVDISRHRHEINLANLAVNRIQRCAFDELIDPSTGYNSDPQVTMMTTSVAELAFRCLQLEKDLRPSMDEVLFFLQDIQSGQACNFEQIKKEANGNYNFHPSPETDAALLKSKDYQSSPTAVTDEWISSSTIASSVT